MSAFDEETRLQGVDGSPYSYSGLVHGSWNIGAAPNGGYLLALAVSALRQAAPRHPDPLSVTVHYLRPGLPGRPCRVDVESIRGGRSLSTLRATLVQDEMPRLEVLAALGELAPDAQQADSQPGDSRRVDSQPEDSRRVDAQPVLTIAAPGMPPPERCVGRSADEQGVQLPILQRLDIRLHPDEARAAAAGRARVSGWVRMRDGRPPDTLACLLFADAFPPSVFGLLGSVGWVPTLELTVHLRRRPVAGWILGCFETFDLNDGRLIEDGALWDSAGNLVAQSRQLALVRGGGLG